MIAKMKARGHFKKSCRLFEEEEESVMQYSKKKMKFSIILAFFLLLFPSLNDGHEDELNNFNTLDVYHADEVPVVKLPVEHTHYVNVIVGNPGKDMRLRIAWGGNVSLVLFSNPEEVSKTYGDHPDTVVVYIGSALVRLGYTIDAYGRDGRRDVAYDGLLGLGRWSDVWRYWSLATLSSKKLVLGAFDENLVRSHRTVFRLKQTRARQSFDVCMGDLGNYSLVFDPSSRYSYFPRQIYRNATLTPLLVDARLRLLLEERDLSEPLVNNFQRPLLRHKSTATDRTIVLGEELVDSCVFYYDAVTEELTIAAAYDFFSDARAQPAYAYFIVVIYYFVCAVWLGVVWTHERHDLGRGGGFASRAHHPRGVLFSMLELYLYSGSLLLLFTESAAFSRVRTMAYYIDADGQLAYYLVFCVVMSVSVVAGSCVAFWTYGSVHLLNVRRVFVETVSMGMLWLAVLPWHNDFALYTLLAVSSIYAFLRTVQCFFAVIMKRDALALLSIVYTLVGVAFLVFYNIVPMLRFYYYGLDDLFYSGLMAFFLVYLAPLLVFLASYPLSIVQSSVIGIRFLGDVARAPPTKRL